VTERLGKQVAIFPTDMALRYAIPFEPVPNLMEKLDRTATTSRSSACGRARTSG